MFNGIVKVKNTEIRWKVEVVTSFDVIEHVENPRKFIKEVYELLAPNGTAIIGTPTDAPIMRELLGEVYEKNCCSVRNIYGFCLKRI